MGTREWFPHAWRLDVPAITCVWLCSQMQQTYAPALMQEGGGGGQRRAQRPKVDSNEVLREFRASGWVPGPPLDEQSADQSILDAVHASERPRVETEERARQLCAFVFAHLKLASMSMVDIFSANLWETAVDVEWAAELLALTDEVRLCAQTCVHVCRACVPMKAHICK